MDITYTKKVTRCGHCPAIIEIANEDEGRGSNYYCELLGEEKGKIRKKAIVLSNCPFIETEGVTKTYKMFGWHEKREFLTNKVIDDICYVFPNIGCVNVCFPDGGKEYVKNGDGEFVELEVKIKKVVKI